MLLLIKTVYVILLPYPLSNDLQTELILVVYFFLKIKATYN